VKARPHLCFSGQCETAFKFYERVLGAKITLMMTYASAPSAENAPPDWRSKILHATLMIGETELAGADVLPEQYQPPQGFFVLLSMPDDEAAPRVFSALSEGGTTLVPFQKTFWSPGFGVLVDQFGTPWEVSCEPAAS
jgi:PhnB protein